MIELLVLAGKAGTIIVPIKRLGKKGGVADNEPILIWLGREINWQ